MAKDSNTAQPKPAKPIHVGSKMTAGSCSGLGRLQKGAIMKGKGK